MKTSLEPFVGDRRQTMQPFDVPPGTDPRPILRGDALKLIRSFAKYGVSNHDSVGAFVWVVVAWCKHNAVPYSITGRWGHGYSITKIETNHEHIRRRA